MVQLVIGDQARQVPDGSGQALISFLSTAITKEERLLLLSVDKKTGRSVFSQFISFCLHPLLLLLRIMFRQ